MNRSGYEVEQDTTSRGNMGKFGSITARYTPLDAVMYYSGWTGYGRQLPHLYDQHMLNNPPPFFVKISGAGTGGTTTVSITLGVTYMGN
jgi:hypothetical protein